jgi:hypothetical protein
MVNAGYSVRVGVRMSRFWTGYLCAGALSVLGVGITVQSTLANAGSNSVESCAQPARSCDQVSTAAVQKIIANQSKVQDGGASLAQAISKLLISDPSRASEVLCAARKADATQRNAIALGYTDARVEFAAVGIERPAAACSLQSALPLADGDLASAVGTGAPGASSPFGLGYLFASGTSVGGGGASRN